MDLFKVKGSANDTSGSFSSVYQENRMTAFSFSSNQKSCSSSSDDSRSTEDIQLYSTIFVGGDFKELVNGGKENMDIKRIKALHVTKISESRKSN